jgi:hypothetical protein
MTHRIVDYLEPVEIQEQHAGVELMPQTARDLGGEPVFQRTAIAEPGQLIRGCGAVELFHQLRVLERNGSGERKRAGQLGFRPAIQLVADPGAEHQHRHPLGAGIEGDHQLRARTDQLRHGHVIAAERGAAGREGKVQGAAVDRRGTEPVVQRAKYPGNVAFPLGPVETGPPGKEDLRHEIQDELFRLFRGVYRRKEPGHLAQRPKLEGRIIERCLPFQQDAPELEHDTEPEGKGHRHRAHLFGHQRVGMDDDLGLAAAQMGDFYRVLEAGRRPHPGHGMGRRAEIEPDPLALESAHESNPAALEQLSLGSGEAASGCEGTG